MQLHETPEGRQLVQNISKAVVSDLAPEELEFFDELAQSDSEAPITTNDEELGFGINEAVVAVTPIALSVVTTVVMFLGNEIVKTAGKEFATTIGKETGTAVLARIKSYFAKSGADAAKVAQQATEMAAQTAQNKGLSKEESDRLAARVMIYFGA